MNHDLADYYGNEYEKDSCEGFHLGAADYKRKFGCRFETGTSAFAIGYREGYKYAAIREGNNGNSSH